MTKVRVRKKTKQSKEMKKREGVSLEVKESQDTELGVGRERRQE